ncbi:hypothetical protein DICPUDRAFT_84356 [Dictyostelium purpureum]|uniref:ADF-H domain-containing protein n=1 Tax=Dictyostelium purpureum TaxID=5786 RepID=F1A2E6_DICPU|nr:uncharacterized protein DICPUDRAFT_84356 [Dictyostelium purpureum]EGC29634.1 hypothetical protein DICPUDRAFT_84356 [Dictyostelium purpureum]|eukprot:XP_003293838.1 hypothetical protein DICPUDRAFT_84356 [Dictyostelium purpureum]
MNSLSLTQFISNIQKHKWVIFENDLSIVKVGSKFEDLCSSFRVNLCLNILIQEASYKPKILQKENNKVFIDPNEQSFILAYYEGPNSKPFEKLHFQDSYFNLVKMLSNKIKIKNVFCFCLNYKDEFTFQQHLKKYSFKQMFQNFRDHSQKNEKSLSDLLKSVNSNQWVLFKTSSNYLINYCIGINNGELKETMKPNETSLIVFKKNDKDILFIICEGNKTRAIEKNRCTLLSHFLYLNLNSDSKNNVELVRITSQDQMNRIEEILNSSSYHDGYNNIFGEENIEKPLGRGSSSVPLISPAYSVKSSAENSPSFFIKKRVSPHSSSPMFAQINGSPRVRTPKLEKKVANVPIPACPDQKTNSINNDNGVNNQNNNNSNQSSPSNNEREVLIKSNSIVLPLSPTSNIVENYNNQRGDEISKINDVFYIDPKNIFNSFDEFNKRTINWILLGYDGKNLRLYAKGNNGLPEMKKHLDEKLTLYGVVGITYSDSRVPKISNTPNTSNLRPSSPIPGSQYKCLFIQWLGLRSSAKQKAMRNSHFCAVSLLFKQKVSIHSEYEVDEVEDLSNDAVLQKLITFRDDIKFKEVVNCLPSSNQITEAVKA